MIGDSTHVGLALFETARPQSQDGVRQVNGSWSESVEAMRVEGAQIASSYASPERAALQSYGDAGTAAEIVSGWHHADVSDGTHPNSGAVATDLYKVIGEKYVELGFDYAPRIFARSLAMAIEEEAKREYASPHMTAELLDKWKLVFSTWRSAWERGQTRLLEQAIVQALEATPDCPEPGATSERPSLPPLPPQPCLDGLTARELEVLCLLTTELSNADLAEKLCLSRRTIHAHLHSIYSKIGVKSRAAATRYAIEHNLIA